MLFFHKYDILNLDVGTSRSTTEIKEERECVSIVERQLGSGNLIGERLVGCHIVAVVEEGIFVMLRAVRII